MNMWTKDKVESQKGKVVIVTGSSSGIGFETAKVFAEKGAKVVIAVRNEMKAEKAIESIKNEFQEADTEFIKLDLADLKSVEDFVQQFNKKYDKLDILINNAGVMIPPYSKTKDGFELQMGTNHLGHFALTALLFKQIKSTPNSRIVNVSSMAHQYGNIDFDDINWEKRKYKAWRAYGDSKIANLYFTYHLNSLLKSAGIDVVVNAAHPGWTATDLQRHSGLFQFLNKFFAMPIWQGALPTLRAATDPSAKGGEFYGPDGFRNMKGYPVIQQSNELSRNKDIAKKLWDVSENMTNIKFNI